MKINTTATAKFWADRAAQDARRIADYRRELARRAADPEAYELAAQEEDERQANEHDAAGYNNAY